MFMVGTALMSQSHKSQITVFVLPQKKLNGFYFNPAID